MSHEDDDNDNNVSKDENKTGLKTLTGIVKGEASNCGEKLVVSPYLRSLSTDSTCNVIEMGDGGGVESKLLPTPPDEHHHHHHNHRRCVKDGDVDYDGDYDDEETERLKSKRKKASDSEQIPQLVIHANKGILFL